MAQIWWVMPKLQCWKEGNRKDDLAQHDETDLQPHTRRKNMAMTRWQKNMPWCCRWLQRRIHGWLKLEKCHWFFQEVKIDHWWLFWSYPPRKCGGGWRIFHAGKIPWNHGQTDAWGSPVLTAKTWVQCDGLSKWKYGSCCLPSCVMCVRCCVTPSVLPSQTLFQHLHEPLEVIMVSWWSHGQCPFWKSHSFADQFTLSWWGRVQVAHDL